MKKMNNKGFSLVELIIVIAIMAILAGALAPALIKYIAKSRRSSDANNCGTIQSSMQTACSNEDADAAFSQITTGKWMKLSDASTSDATTGDFWSVVDEDLSGGLAAFTKTKTSKLADGSKFKSVSYAYYISDKGDIHVGIYGGTGNKVYECVPVLHVDMGGTGGTTGTSTSAINGTEVETQEGDGN